MNFTVENEAFAKALALVKSCIPTRSTIPILSHVAVEAKADNVLVIRATSLDREIEAVAKADVSSAGGAALPGEILSGLARKLTKGGQSTISMKDDRCKLVSGSSKYDLRTLPLADFPSGKAMADDAVKFSLEAKQLLGLIGSTAYVADAACPHFYGRGVHLHVANRQLIAVASDNHRVARRSVDIPKGAATMPPVTLPAESLPMLLSLLADTDETAEVAVTRAMVEIRLLNLRFATALLDVQFPDYDKVIPKLGDKDHGATFRAYALSEAIDRATVVYLGEKDISKKTPFADVRIKGGNIVLQAGAKGAETGSETVEAETNGLDLHLGVHAGYLAEMLKAWPESVDVDVWQKQSGAPILFTAKDRPDMVHVLMPRRGDQ